MGNECKIFIWPLDEHDGKRGNHSVDLVLCSQQ